MKTLLCLLLLSAVPAAAQIPNLESVARQVFDSRPSEIVTLRQLCDQTDALRAQYGEDDPRVQDGEVRANAVKGMFTRRIAYAVHQIDPRFGLRRKDAGAHAVRPIDGVSLATDVVLWRDSGQVIDVMSDRNPSWGLTPGDVQPVNQWVEPLPEAEDSPMPNPILFPPSAPTNLALPQPPGIGPLPVPAPVSALDYSGVLQQILDAQNQLLQSQADLLAIAKDTNVHVTNIDHTFAQTIGHISAFLGKYVGPAVAGYIAAKKIGQP